MPYPSLPRFSAFAAPALGALALVGGAPAAHAQILYLGYSNSTNFSKPGSGTLTSAGTTATGAFSFVNSSPSTTSYADWELYNTSSAVISGGSTASLHASDDSTAVVSGGVVGNVFALAAPGSSSLITVSGGSLSYLFTQGGGVLNLLGTGLTESKTVTSINGANYYAVSGTFQGSATPFTADYSADNTGTLEFNGTTVSAPAVPEAGSVLSLGVLLALGGLGLAARRGRTARAAA